MDLQCLIDGADEYLQLLDVASNTIRALCNMPQEGSYDSSVAFELGLRCSTR